MELQANVIAQKVRYYLITKIGKFVDEANDEEFYRALCAAFRDEIMVNWIAINHAFKKKNVRRLYYLSMEYMPGRLLGNNITNIGAVGLMKNVLSVLKRDFHSVLSMEPDIGIGNGGLGRLASCFLDSLATLQYPAMGYGLRYQYGIFEQELVCGVQIERPDCWLLTQNPWEVRRDSRAISVRFGGTLLSRKNCYGEEVYDLMDFEEVRALPYDLPIVGYSEDSNFSVLTLRLWSTKESPCNFQLQRYNAGETGKARENMGLTDVLYPNDNNEVGKRTRLKQEFLLVSASLQDIVNQYKESNISFANFADVVRIQINDTHPTLVIPELMHLFTKECGISWNEGWEMVRTCCSYTNHTVLKEALEMWNVERFTALLPRHFAIIQRLNATLCSEIEKKFPNDAGKKERMSIIQEGQIRMANLAIYGSHCVNGVAKLHTEILKKSLFKDFYDLYPEKFLNITNGVTQRRWLLHCNPLLSSFLTKRIGNRWITNFRELQQIVHYANDPSSQREFLHIKRMNKERLFTMIKDAMHFHHEVGRELPKEFFLDPQPLFDVQVKRIHEYKRQLMRALYLAMLYYDIKENPNSQHIKRLVMFGGKAAPGYQRAKNIIRFISCLCKKINNDPDMNGFLKVIYIEDYNVSRAEILIPGTDLSEQISTAGLEASGTGNMKFAINGALTIATSDGANVEMRESIKDEWWPFMFGASAEEINDLRNSCKYHPQDIYEKEPMIRRVIDSLGDHVFAENDAEHQAFLDIRKSLMGSAGCAADCFFVLYDLMSYYEMQKKVESLYKDPMKWAQYAIYNIGGMGCFSSDISIENYVKHVWQLTKCSFDAATLERVCKEYGQAEIFTHQAFLES